MVWTKKMVLLKKRFHLLIKVIDGIPICELDIINFFNFNFLGYPIMTCEWGILYKNDIQLPVGIPSDKNNHTLWKLLFLSFLTQKWVFLTILC